MPPRWSTWGIGIAAAAISLSPAFGQSPNTNTWNQPTASMGSNAPSMEPDENPAISRRSQPVTMMITGRVMLEDGAPPPMNVVIESVCGGTSHAEGYTDGEGYFSVKLGQQGGGVMEDASESAQATAHAYFTDSGIAGSMNRFASCDLRARLGGFRSQTVSLLDHGPMDNPDIGVILLHPTESSQAATVTPSDLKASKRARQAAQKGLDWARKNKLEQATANFQEAVRIDPEYATAWCELGKVQELQGQLVQAQQSFETASKIEPHWPDPLLELSLVALHAQNWERLSDVTDRIIQLDSFSYPQAFFMNAMADYMLKRLSVAERSAREAGKLDTRHQYPETAHLLAAILAEQHHYAGAADQLRHYLAAAPKASDAAQVRLELDDMERRVRAEDSNR